MGTAEFICLTICITVGVIVLICVVGKSCRQCRRLSYEEKMENMKWLHKKLWEEERAKILNKKAWFEEELGKIRKEQEELKDKIELL